MQTGKRKIKKRILFLGLRICCINVTTNINCFVQKTMLTVIFIWPENIVHVYLKDLAHLVITKLWVIFFGVD